MMMIYDDDDDDGQLLFNLPDSGCWMRSLLLVYFFRLPRSNDDNIIVCWFGLGPTVDLDLCGIAGGGNR